MDPKFDLKNLHLHPPADGRDMGTAKLSKALGLGFQRSFSEGLFGSVTLAPFLWLPARASSGERQVSFEKLQTLYRSL